MAAQAEDFMEGARGREVEDRPLLGGRNYYLSLLDDDSYPESDVRWAQEAPFADLVRAPRFGTCVQAKPGRLNRGSTAVHRQGGTRHRTSKSPGQRPSFATQSSRPSARQAASRRTASRSSAPSSKSAS